MSQAINDVERENDVAHCCKNVQEADGRGGSDSATERRGSRRFICRAVKQLRPADRLCSPLLV